MIKIIVVISLFCSQISVDDVQLCKEEMSYCVKQMSKEIESLDNVCDWCIDNYYE